MAVLCRGNRIPIVVAAMLVGLALIGPKSVGQSELPPAFGVVVLPEYRVTSERVAALESPLGRAELRQPEPNLGRELMDVPGVYGHSRAADAMEPNIRGFGFDRVTTTLNGIPFFNGSPERTYSPVVLLGPVAVDHLTVIKALPSVALGPATSGGRIDLRTEPLADEPTGAIHGFVATTYNGGRDGLATQGMLRGQAGPWSARVTFFQNDLGDYSAPDGRIVAGRLEDFGGSAGVGWRNDHQYAYAEYVHRRLVRNETVALPLDGQDSDAAEFTFNHRWTPGRGALEKIEWRAGYGFTDPFITSAHRAGTPLIEAQATTRSAAGGLNSLWNLGTDGTLNLGGDFSRSERRAVRTTAAGKDYIWPDAIYDDLGWFAEWQRPLGPQWLLRVGGRGDLVRSDARDVDQLALGRPIRQQFVLYNGPAAAQVKREDWVGAGNVLLNWSGARGWSGFWGAGFSAQPAPATERYRAFLNALGGDGKGGNALELGNPALSSERKWEFAAGGAWNAGPCTLSANLYYDFVDDFILRLPIGMTRPPVARMVVFGYRNVPAELGGGELGVTWRVADGMTVPLTFAVAQGKNRDTGIGLAEIPPWEATAAIRAERKGSRFGRWWQAGLRLVGEKDNPAPLDNPLYSHSGGYVLAHLRGGVRLGRLRLEAGIENLTDRRYSEYLMPPVAPFKPASGNLFPGERVPGPGRWSWATATWEF